MARYISSLFIFISIINLSYAGSNNIPKKPSFDKVHINPDDIEPAKKKSNQIKTKNMVERNK